MPEKKTKVQIPGNAGLFDAAEVGVRESHERWTEVTLDDDSVIKLKSIVVSATRVLGQHDNDGNPLYLLKINPIMAVAYAPDHLKKGGSGTPKGVQ